MAKFGFIHVDIAEYTMISYVNGGQITLDNPLPTDGSLLLAVIKNGTVSFNAGDRRIAVFYGGSFTNHANMGSGVDYSSLPIGWLFITPPGNE